MIGPRLLVVVAVLLVLAPLSMVHAAPQQTLTSDENTVTQLTGGVSSTTDMLVGCYQCWNYIGGWCTVMGRCSDYQIDMAFSSPSGWWDIQNVEGGYPIIAAVAMMDGTGCTTFTAAANGDCNNLYDYIVNNVLVPYASHIYAISINTEWIGGWMYYSPICDPSQFAAGCPSDLGSLTPEKWITGTRNLISRIKAAPALADVKIEVDSPLKDRQVPYWPGDDIVDLAGEDLYFDSQWFPTSQQAWIYWCGTSAPPCTSTSTLGYIAQFAQQHTKPMIIPQWCDTYTDGYIIPRFASWMVASNVVANSYWNSNDDIGDGSSCVLANTRSGEPTPKRLQSYISAFGGTSYTGTYWPSYLALPRPNPYQ